MADHAELSASGSARWLNCPGSVVVNRKYADKSSVFADEGTVAHELGFLCLSKKRNTDYYLDQQLISNIPIKVDQDMVDNVQVYVDFIRSIPGDHLYEQRVDYSDYAPGGFGTSDFIGFDGATKTMVIGDLKYGKGILVNATGNTQMRLYALGALCDYGHLYEIDNVVMHIIQPRLDNISTDEITVPELLKWGEWVKEKAELALTDDAPRVPSEKACEWCKHTAVCPERLALATKALMCEFDSFDTVPVNTLTDEQLRFALDNAKLITSWLSAVEAHVIARLEDGDQFNGYKLVEGRSSREWIDEEEVVATLSEYYDQYELFEQKFLSVAKAEKLLGKRKLNLIEDKVVKKAGKPTLVPSSDKRPSLLLTASDFDVIDD